MYIILYIYIYIYIVHAHYAGDVTIIQYIMIIIIINIIMYFTFGQILMKLHISVSCRNKFNSPKDNEIQQGERRGQLLHKVQLLEQKS